VQNNLPCYESGELGYSDEMLHLIFIRKWVSMVMVTDRKSFNLTWSYHWKRVSFILPSTLR